MNGFVLWFTGIPSSGKSTLAAAVAERLARRGLALEILDGDEVRPHLSAGLGFSRHDRDVNVRRVGYVCNLLARNGVIAIAALVSPYRATRDQVRAACQAPFVEVLTACPVAVAAARDPKGLYARQAQGELSGLTGVDDPYEEPLQPDLVCATDQLGVEECAASVLQLLERRRLIAPPPGAGGQG
ncbi:MAG: adenylyl-sulfate kinase [Deltaproteobacteria bacterium]|nr:adenylyl-sulfate kinase [Deltaproteobacteria bacterium]